MTTRVVDGVGCLEAASLDHLDVEHHSGFVLEDVAVEHVGLLALEAMGVLADRTAAPSALLRPEATLAVAGRGIRTPGRRSSSGAGRGHDLDGQAAKGAGEKMSREKTWP